MLSNGTEAWLFGHTDGCRIEPVAIQEGAPESVVASPSDQAYAMAQSMGLVYVSDVSALLKPSAGTACQDDAVNGVVTYLDNFTSELSDQIVAARASSREAISVITSNGIEVSLGAPVDIAAEEPAVLEPSGTVPRAGIHLHQRARSHYALLARARRRRDRRNAGDRRPGAYYRRLYRDGPDAGF